MPGKTCKKCGRSMDEHWREEGGPYECPTSQVNGRQMRLGLEFVPRFAFDPAKTRTAIEAVRAAEAEANDERELAIRQIAQAEMELQRVEGPSRWRVWSITLVEAEKPGEPPVPVDSEVVEVEATTSEAAKALYREQHPDAPAWLRVEFIGAPATA